MAPPANSTPPSVLVRGGGDLASGVILRLARAGVRVWVSELPQPMAVRRMVSFAQAVYDGEHVIEGVTARRTATVSETAGCLERGIVPVLVDPGGAARPALNTLVIVDGRMTKTPPDLGLDAAELVLGLGPGFCAGENCHAVVETKRGPFLGRVIWQGSAEADTGQPETVFDKKMERVLRAPADGVLTARAVIGGWVEAGQVIAEVGGEPVTAAFAGTLRGLIQPGIPVQAGMKIGDLDPRSDPQLAFLVSDKALAVGGGILEAILARPEIRGRLWA